MIDWRAAAGRAFSANNSAIYSVFEAIERACLISGWDNDPRINESQNDTDATASTLELTNFSARQRAELQSATAALSTIDFTPPHHARRVVAQSLLANERTSLPARSVLFGEDVRDGLPPVFSSSSGAALRGTRADAARHGTLELVERDGVAIWWYNRLIPKRLAVDAAAAALPADLAAFLAARRRQTWHLALPSDLGVPAIVALSARSDGSAPAIGAAAALDPADAVRSATLELLQGEINLSLMRQAQRAPNPPPVPPLLAWSASTNALADPALAGVGTTDPTPATRWDTLLGTFAEKGIDLYAVDLTRAEFGVPVVKAVSPQLRDWLPRFGPGRLYEVPVALGIQTAPTPEDALNPVPFVI
ncbi:YcaO-like family protein [Acuticoccus sp. MNP-M23]|uniref:YcaO-like family protein n=1 Tax=Acuticoccus sp. MNP-M23 TaxID=3072793 RepID=UPI002814BC01|nr:YcaO-like family protein [Acuticoccus sp. MNP-M23]WMS45128.1 YcaO-like family protein [Acuticoccus sp. MNP-M23]